MKRLVILILFFGFSLQGFGQIEFKYFDRFSAMPLSQLSDSLVEKQKQYNSD